MTQLVRKLVSRRRFSILILALAIGSGTAPHPAAAGQSCASQVTGSNPGDLSLEDDRDIRVLINNFFDQTYDSRMTDGQRRNNLTTLFTPTFRFEVCDNDHDSLFVADKDLDKLDKQINQNYHWLWDHGVTPKHTITPKTTVLKLIDKDKNIVKETTTGFSVFLTPPLGDNNPDYTARIESVIIKDGNGIWRFQERFFILDKGFKLASYGR